MPNVSPSAPATNVAPLAGSVDRNQFRDKVEEYMALSLPSRGAWIEMAIWPGKQTPPSSLPSRGAWIEMARHSTT